MAFVSALGGTLDVSPLISYNIQGDTLFAPQYTGNDTRASKMLGDMQTKVDPVRAGDWVFVPDNFIEVSNGYFGSDVFLRQRSGGKILLESNERRGEWISPDWLVYDYVNVYVQVNSKTYDALVEIGVVTTSTPKPPPPIVKEEAVPVTNAIIKTSNAVIIVALLIAAVYFVPKDILR